VLHAAGAYGSPALAATRRVCAAVLRSRAKHDALAPGTPGSPRPQGRTSLLRGEGGEVRTTEALATGGPPAWRASVRRAGGASGEERAHRATHESVVGGGDPQGPPPIVFEIRGGRL